MKEHNRLDCPAGIHGDLWAEIASLIKARGSTVTFTKVKAHITDEDFVSNACIDAEDYAGNHYADLYADLVAELNKVPWHVSNEIEKLRTRNAIVLNRLVAINTFILENAPQRAGIVRPKKDPSIPSSLQASVQASGHIFDQCPKFLCNFPASNICRACNQKVIRCKLKSFLRNGKCSGKEQWQRTAPGAIAAKRPPVGSTTRVGRSDLHRTHRLLTHRSLWWCSACR